MAKTFNLTAELNLQAPRNISAVVSQIQAQLRPVNLAVNLQVSASAVNSLNQLNNQLTLLRANLAAINSSTNSFNGIATSIGKVNNAASASAKSLQSQSQAFTNTRKTIADAKTEMEAFGFQTALAIRRFAAFGVGTAGILGLVGAIKSGVTEAIHFNKEMVRLSQVTGKSLSELSDVSDEITRLSIGLGVSSKELLDVSTTLAQAGLTAKETKIALEALAKSSLAPSFDNMKQTTEGVIAVMHQFKIGATEVESALGSINSVAAAFAVESQDLISAVRIAGGVFSAASTGVATGTEALNQFISVITAVRSTTRESAESIATGLRTIFTRVQRPRTIEFLKEFGVNLTDIEGKFVGPYEAAKRLSEGLKGLDTRDLKFTKIGEELGGYRQLNKVIPLIKEFSVAQEALGIAQRGATSLTKDAETAQQSFANQITKVSERFLALIRTVSQSKTFEFLTQFALKTADAFIKLAESIEPILPFLTILAGIKLSSSAFQFGSGFIGGIQRGNSGGKKFAKGGLVPGTGNGDTVPAHLTPGEFVIRKDAVKALGTDFLENANKYSLGSNVVPAKFTAPKGLNTDARKAAGVDVKMDGNYGGMFFQLSTAAASGPAELSNGLVVASDLKEPDKAAIAAKIGLTSANGKPLNIKNVLGQPYQFFPSKQRGDEFDDIAKTQLNNSIHAVLGAAGGLNAVAKTTKLTPDALIATMEKQIGFEHFAGGIWEAYISAIAGQVSDERGRNFDLIAPSPGSLSPIFGPGVSKLGYGDAKFTSSPTNRGSLVSKAARQFLAGGEGLSVTTLHDKKEADVFASGKARADEILEATGDLSSIRVSRTPKKKASGGNIDTVGALLTPGEFVIRKEAAQRLGRPTLEKMNHADKIQKFAHGGFVGFSTGGPAIGAGSGLTPDQIDKLTKFLTAAGVSAEHMSDAFDSAVVRMKSFGESAKTAANQVGNLGNSADAGLAKTKLQGPLDASVPRNAAGEILTHKNATTTADLQAIADHRGAQRRARDFKTVTTPEELEQFKVNRKNRREDAVSKARNDVIESNSISSQTSRHTDPFDVDPLEAAGLIPKQGRLAKLRAGAKGLASELAPSGSFVGKGLDKLKGVKAGGLATAAFFASPLVEKAASSVLGDSPQGKATSSALSTGFSGAAAGAAAGSVAGPIGTVVGGAVGGIVSALSAYENSIKESTLAEELRKLSVSTELADGVMKRFALGKANDSEVNNAIEAQLRDSSNKESTSLFSAQNSGLEAVYGGGFSGKAQARFNNLPIVGDTSVEKKARIDKFQNELREKQFQDLKPVAANSETFFKDRLRRGIFDSGGEANDAAIRGLATGGEKGRERAKILSNLDGVDKVKQQRIFGEARLKELAKEQKELDKTAGAAGAANVRLELLAQSFDKMTANVARAVSETDTFNITTENLANSIGGKSVIGRAKSNTDILTNSSGYSVAEIKKDLGGLTKNIGRPDITEKLTGTIAGSRALEDELPNRLLKLFQTSEQGGGDGNKTNTNILDEAQKIIGEIETQNGIKIPEEFKADISAKLNKGTSQQTSESGNTTAEYLGKQFGEDIKKLGEVPKKAALELRKGLEGANATYLAGVNQFVQLQLQADDARASFAGNKAERGNELAKLGGKTLSGDERFAPTQAKISSLVTRKFYDRTNPSGAINNVSDITNIGKSNDALRAEKATLEQTRSKQEASGDPALTGTIKALAQNERELANNNSALKLVVNSNDRLAAINDKLAQQQKLREGGQDAVLEYATATPEERAKIARGNQLATAIETGQVKKGSLANNAEAVTLANARFQKKNALELDENKRKAAQANFTNQLSLATTGKGTAEFTGNDNTSTAIRAGGTAQTQVEKEELGKAGKISDIQNAADAELLKAYEQLPIFMQNLDKQFMDITEKIKKSVADAFQKPTEGEKGMAAFGPNDLQQFGSHVNTLKAAMDTFAAAPKVMTHTLAPMTVNVNYNGITGLEGTMEQVAINAGNELLKRSLPLDAVLDKGAMVT